MKIILVVLAMACLEHSYEGRSILLISRPIQRVYNHNAARGGPFSPGRMVLVRRPLDMSRGPSPYNDDGEYDDNDYDDDYARGPCGACADPCECGGRNCGCTKSLPLPMMVGGGAMMGGMIPEPSGPDYKKNVKHIKSPDGTQTDITTITGPGMKMQTVHSSKVVKVVGKKPDTQAQPQPQGAKPKKEESPKDDEEDEGALNPNETQKAKKPTKKEESETKVTNAKDSLMGNLQIKQKNEAEAEDAEEEDDDDEEEEPSEDENKADDEEEEDEQKQDDDDEAEEVKNKKTNHKAKNIPNKGHTVEDGPDSGLQDSKEKGKGKTSDTKDRTNDPAPKKLKNYKFKISIENAPKQLKKEAEVEKPAAQHIATPKEDDRVNKI